MDHILLTQLYLLSGQAHKGFKCTFTVTQFHLLDFLPYFPSAILDPYALAWGKKLMHLTRYNCISAPFRIGIVFGAYFGRPGFLSYRQASLSHSCDCLFIFTYSISRT